MSTESVLNVKIEPWAYAPERAYAEDAGLDLKIPHQADIWPDIEQAEELAATERGDSGFGSTGR